MVELTNFIPNFFAQDSFLILDMNFNQLFSDARPTKSNIKETSKVMEHPLETGVTITDHRIINPIEIDMTVVIDVDNYISTYNQIKYAFLNARLLKIQTRTGLYENMLLSDMPHPEDTTYFNVIVMELKFREAQFVTAQYSKLPPSKVKKTVQASTAKNGEVKPKEADYTSFLGKLIRK